MRYGFNCNIHTLDQIAEALGVTKTRIRNIEQDSKRKIRMSPWGRMKMLEKNIEFGEWWKR